MLQQPTKGRSKRQRCDNEESQEEEEEQKAIASFGNFSNSNSKNNVRQSQSQSNVAADHQADSRRAHQNEEDYDDIAVAAIGGRTEPAMNPL